MIELSTYLDTLGQISYLGTIWINKKYIVSVVRYKDTALYSVTLVNGVCLVDDTILQKIEEWWVSGGKMGEWIRKMDMWVRIGRTRPFPAFVSKFRKTHPPLRTNVFANRRSHAPHWTFVRFALCVLYFAKSLACFCVCITQKNCRKIFL